MNPVLDAIVTRRSVRSFRNEQIALEDLKNILLAGSYAPNGMGEQSWKFTAVQNSETMQKINEAIRQTLLSITVVAETHPYIVSLINKAKDEKANFLYHAPTYIIVSNLKDRGTATADTALAIGNMMLAAHSMGIGSCWVNQLSGLAHLPLIRKLLAELSVPENHVVYGSVVMGYAADPPEPADPRKDVIHIIR